MIMKGIIMRTPSIAWNLCLLLLLFVSGCSSSGYSSFYQDHTGGNSLANVYLLEDGQEPELVKTSDLEESLFLYLSKNYVTLGASSFNGQLESDGKVIKQAKNVGATVVVAGAQYTNTENRTGYLSLPDTQTTYYNGSVSTYGGYGTYSGSSTTYGTRTIPYSVSQRRYDQAAYFLAKSRSRPKIGVFAKDLTMDQRSYAGTNFGVYVFVVVEMSPAYKANVLPGDVVVGVDGVGIKNEVEFHEYVKNMTQSPSYFDVIRDRESVRLLVE